MADVWTSDKYNIQKVSEYTSDGTVIYSCEIQRLQEDTYSHLTTVEFPQNLGKFPANLSKENFLANALPEINTAFEADDAISYTTIGSWN